MRVNNISTFSYKSRANNYNSPTFSIQKDSFVKNPINFKGNTDKTIEWYDKNAVDYANQTRNLDMESVRNVFLENIPKGGTILEVGSGSGRDTKHFLDNGYKVTAVDKSSELAKQAEEYTGQKVIVDDVKNLNFKNKFDGVWDLACLVHSKSKEELHKTYNNLSKALKSGGYLYTTFKIGEGLEFKTDERGRSMVFMDQDSFKNLMKEHKELKIEKIWFSTDALGRASTSWCNYLLKKVK